jgi:hypothetical protein
LPLELKPRVRNVGQDSVEIFLGRQELQVEWKTPFIIFTISKWVVGKYILTELTLFIEEMFCSVPNMDPVPNIFCKKI